MDFRFSVPNIKYIIMKNQLNGMLDNHRDIKLNPKDILTLDYKKCILYYILIIII